MFFILNILFIFLHTYLLSQGLLLDNSHLQTLEKTYVQCTFAIIIEHNTVTNAIQVYNKNICDVNTLTLWYGLSHFV